MASNSGSGTVWTRRRFAWCWTSYGDDSPSGQCTSVFVPESLRHAPELRRAARARAGSSPVGSICRPSLPVRQQAQRSAQDSVLGPLLRELLEAQRNRKSEQLSKEQLKLFEELWKARQPEEASEEPAAAGTEGDEKPPEAPVKKRTGRQPLAKNLVRERIVHDLTEAEKHCDGCGKDLHLISEETSERYEFIPAQLKVIEDVCLKYACDCTVKTADK